MMKTLRFGTLALIAGMAFVALAPGALAQKKPDAAATAAPAKAKKPKKVKAPSLCKGLNNKACTAKADTCRWIGATTRKDGKKVKAYCRKLPTRASTTKTSTKKSTRAAAPAQPAAKSTKTSKTKKKVAKKPAPATKAKTKAKAKAPPASAN